MRVNRKALYVFLGMVVFTLVLVGFAGTALADLTLRTAINTSGSTPETSASLLSQCYRAHPDSAPSRKSV
jgi:hypothetical protein